ncbi:MAG: hypothetical protein ABIP28_02975, partial [Mucilaginibacter sp.]
WLPLSPVIIYFKDKLGDGGQVFEDYARLRLCHGAVFTACLTGLRVFRMCGKLSFKIIARAV